jgi:hypothetical protein
MNWFQGAQQPNSSTGAAMQGVFNPWAQQAAQGAYSPQMVQGARGDLLAQLGMGLMAAGQPMSGAQRAQYLAQIGQMPAAYQQNLAQRLEAQQKAQLFQQQQAAYAQQQAYAEVLSKATPEQLKELGISPAMQTLWKSMPAAQRASIAEKRMTSTADPVNWQTVQTDQGVFAFNPQNPSQTMRIGGTPAKSPELVNMQPPQGSNTPPVTLDVANPEGYSHYQELAKQGWTRQPASAVTVNTGDQKITETQSKDIGYYYRGLDVNREFSKLEKELTHPSAAITQNFRWGGVAQTPQEQQAIRAGREFAAIVLRRESGAAVQPFEMEQVAQIYLPQVGDSPEAIADKARARKRELASIKAGLGTASSLGKSVEEQLGIQPSDLYNPQDPTGLGAP